jgi:hypothetical protein
VGPDETKMWLTFRNAKINRPTPRKTNLEQLRAFEKTKSFNLQSKGKNHFKTGFGLILLSKGCPKGKSPKGQVTQRASHPSKYYFTKRRSVCKNSQSSRIW